MFAFAVAEPKISPVIVMVPEEDLAIETTLDAVVIYLIPFKVKLQAPVCEKH